MFAHASAAPGGESRRGDGRRGHRHRWNGVALWTLVALAALGGHLVPARLAAQERMVITGFVQWIDGQTMEVMADSGYSIRVNLERVDQSSYNTLNPGDQVRVAGFVAPDRSQLIAERITAGGADVYDSSNN